MKNAADPIAQSASENQNDGVELERGTYEILRHRLQTQADSLRQRLTQLNASRAKVFGAIPTELLSSQRITTEHNCVARDIVAIGDHLLFGYNVQMGLKSETHLGDVFSVYQRQQETLIQQPLDLIQDSTFEHDFKQLYKYYKGTRFSKFQVIGPHVYFVFQVGEDSLKNIKSFKFLLTNHELIYIDNRSDHEVKFPPQHEFLWTRTHRDLHRAGRHPHISIDDRVFVETVGGDLTIKIEDNTEDGQGIYREPVSDRDQTLDDAEIFYAIVGNLILLKIKPFREEAFRYFVFNEKTSQARRIDSIQDACVSLPEDHGLIFSNGYYLQTGVYKTFETGLNGLIFEKQLPSANGEDFLYVFYNPNSGAYLLLSYNLITQTAANPISCHGYSFFDDGKMLISRSEATPQKHHPVQFWQTPFVAPHSASARQTTEFQDSILFKIGNRDIVRAMSECNEVLSLIDKEDTYTNLYVDLVKKSTDLLDNYFWLDKAEAFQVEECLQEIRSVATTTIDEFEKVTQNRKASANQFNQVAQRAKLIVSETYKRRFSSIDDFVQLLAELRNARGEIISLKDLKYIDLPAVESLEQSLKEAIDQLSQKTVDFLAAESALEPYQKRISEQLAAIAAIAKVTEAKHLQTQIDQTAKDLELLIEIVSNLKIEDATTRTQIVDSISAIYSQLNQSRAKLKTAAKQLLGVEGKAEFHAQVKLLSQAIVNYLEVSDTPQKCDEYLSRMMVQIEELEGRFAEFDEFVVELATKREEVYSAFETRKIQLQEAKNRRSQALYSAAERILAGVRGRISKMTTIDQINSYFAGDLMIDKVRDILTELEQLDDSVKTDDIQSRLKAIREDAIGQLKDRQDLFVDGTNIIQFGKHRFSTNIQNLDLTTIAKDNRLFFHLTGTNYFQDIPSEVLSGDSRLWSQEVVSENLDVYRSEYLAKLILDEITASQETILAWTEKTDAELLESVQAFMQSRYQEAYVKGVHDRDAAKILQKLIHTYQQAGPLRSPPPVRNLAMLFWLQAEWSELNKSETIRQLEGVRELRKAFPHCVQDERITQRIHKSMVALNSRLRRFPDALTWEAAKFLYEQVTLGQGFAYSLAAEKLRVKFLEYLDHRELRITLDQTLDKIPDPNLRWELLTQWFTAFANHDLPSIHNLQQQLVNENEATPASDPQHSQTPNQDVPAEAALIHLLGVERGQTQAEPSAITITSMLGNHPRISNAQYQLSYYDFVSRLTVFQQVSVPEYLQFVESKKTLLSAKRKQLKLEQFQPKVLTSFVRNRLINEVYLPLIGANLAKQIGAIGDQKRTDLMGLLLLVSPPGYGKTTLMEYVANRLGITFMKINGPSIGHHVTSLDPGEAPNLTARQEVEKLNLAFEMGDNVMIYLDDIQHCNPEFLQKFISLSDGQRKIDGVFQGEGKTYDLRGKKVCVVMAGNPYTESGDKFQIPDMLSNRADTYNLGDVIGDARAAFELSYLENCLTSNSSLAPLQSRSQKDIYAVVEMATHDSANVSLEGNYSTGEISEMVQVMRKLIRVRKVLLQVNALYIQSAAQADEYRTEPAFKLQGSYRDMNKIAERIVPVMNDAELETLIYSHYENQAQTLTTDAEANLLKFAEISGRMNAVQKQRWESIKHIYKKNLLLGAAAQSDDKVSQVIAQLSTFSEGLYELRNALDRGVSQMVDSMEDPKHMAIQNLAVQQMGGAVEQLVRFNQAIQQIQDSLMARNQAAKAEPAMPTKIHVTNRIPSAFMKVITGQFQILQTWVEPIIAWSEKMEDANEVRRAMKATQKYYEKILEATAEEQKQSETDET